MSNYKVTRAHENQKLDLDDSSDEEEKYLPQISDLPNLYYDIQQSFEQKNSDELKHALDKIKSYISQYEIDFSSQFQDILFPVLIEICQNSENEGLALYGFKFISFIMKNDIYISYIPLFTEPDFFDFCFSFLQNDNHEIVFWALDNIESFINQHINARDYSLDQLTIDIIINQFINVEENEIDIRIKSFIILQCYTSYEIDEESADQIFDTCYTYLGKEACYEVFYETALWTAFNLIKSFKKYVTPQFLKKINKFYSSPSVKHIIPTLNILKFLISHNSTPENTISKNFIYLFLYDDKKVGKLSIECLSLILENQEKGAFKQLYKNGFFEKLSELLSNQCFSTRRRAAEIVCTILEDCIPYFSREITTNDFIHWKKMLTCHIHAIFLVFELEEDNLTYRTLNALYMICSRMKISFILNSDEKQALDELIDSESEEISELASNFKEKFLAVRKPLLKSTNIHEMRKGPKKHFRVEEPISMRSTKKLWEQPHRVKQRDPMFQNLSDCSYCYNDQDFSDDDENYNNDDFFM